MKKVSTINYIGESIKIFLVKNFKRGFCNHYGSYNYVEYEYLIIYNDLTGEIYHEMNDFYRIKRFLIQKGIIKG